MRNTHEIYNYFYSNRLNTRLICNICETNYDLKSNLTNLKNHFEKYHNDEYQKIIEKNKERQKEIRKQNQITRQEKEKSRIEEKNLNKKNTLIEQNNINTITKYYPSVQIEDKNITDYETEEVVTSGQVRVEPEIEEGEIVIEREIKRPWIEREILFKSIVLEKNSSIDLIFNDVNIKINRKCILNFK